jgi:hypothetical protein
VLVKKVLPNIAWLIGYIVGSVLDVLRYLLIGATYLLLSMIYVYGYIVGAFEAIYTIFSKKLKGSKC